MQTSKRLVYDKISKFFPLDQPFYLQPNQILIENCLVYQDPSFDEEVDCQYTSIPTIYLDSSSCIDSSHRNVRHGQFTSSS